MTDRHVTDILPWYVNNQIDQAERSRVQKHLTECEACRVDYQSLNSLAADVKRMDSEQFDLTTGFSRLKTRILDEGVSQQQSKRKPGLAWERWTRPLFAIAASLIVAQAFVIGTLLPEQSEGLVPLSGKTAASEGAVVQLTFKTGATEQQLRDAIRSVNGNIVSGPGALGIYNIATSGADFQAAVDRLKNNPNVESVRIAP